MKRRAMFRWISGMGLAAIGARVFGADATKSPDVKPASKAAAAPGDHPAHQHSGAVTRHATRVRRQSERRHLLPSRVRDFCVSSHAQLAFAPFHHWA